MKFKPITLVKSNDTLARARSLLAEACPFDAAASVAEEVIFGPALGYTETYAQAIAVAQSDKLAGLVVCCGPWIRVLAVHPGYRMQGIGSALLDSAEAYIADTGATDIRVLDQPGNYLAPGIDVRNHDTIAWLLKRGYYRHCERVNLLVDVVTNPALDHSRCASLRASLTNYELRRAQFVDAEMLTNVIAAQFAAGWAFEVERALSHVLPSVHVAISHDTGEIAAFACHGGNNHGLGWFGPAGTLPKHRGRGLGRMLLYACLHDIAAAGHRHCEIAWIGPREFYQRTAGTIGERRFAVLRKEPS